MTEMIEYDEFSYFHENASEWDLPYDGPPEVARVADNYNHLHEQPTTFYALALSAQPAGATDSLAIGLAWGYVSLRMIHSLVQATRNPIPIRFGIFSLGSLVLLALLVRTILAL